MYGMCRMCITCGNECEWNVYNMYVWNVYNMWNVWNECV